MVIRNSDSDGKKKSKAKEVEEENEGESDTGEGEKSEVSADNLPMIPNYLDLILGEVHAIRLSLEKQ